MPKKELVGKVVSNKMDKTVVVTVENRHPHPKYEKQIIETRRFKAHDEGNKCEIGDRVRIQECRPLSREKRWLVVETISHDIATKPTEESLI
jgi:small subunit ribosomal protein S17